MYIYIYTRLQSQDIEIRGVLNKNKPIYQDQQATSRIDYRVQDAMQPFMQDQYGNPHSRTHQYGWEASAAIEIARENVAKQQNAKPQEIFFTSGATESNNTLLKGYMHFMKNSKRKHLITTQIEHKCILDSCRYLETEGYDVTYLPVDKYGQVNIDDIEKNIREDTAMVSIIQLNNEVGTIQPIEKIGKLCRKYGIKLHTDGAQAVGKIPIDVESMNIDCMSISSHKIYGPKGMGAMYVRRRPRMRIEPILSGGGQERGLRSGTLAPHLVVGLGEACKIAKEDMEYDHKYIRKLSHKLYNHIMTNIPNVVLNGPSIMNENERYIGNLNFSFSYVEGESQLMGMEEIALSSGSACTSASLEPSYVLRALGVSEDQAHTSLRFGIGRFTTEEEIDITCKSIVREVNRLRELSPLWEMMKQGIDPSTIQWTV